MPYVMHVKDEGCIDCPNLFLYLGKALMDGGVIWNGNTYVTKVYNGTIVSSLRKVKGIIA